MIRIARTLSTWAKRRVNHEDSPLRLARCVLCLGRAGPTGLCPACLEDLPDNRVACERCALPLATPDPNRLCNGCLIRTPPQDFSVVPWRYEFPIDRMIQSYKYQGTRGPGRALALSWPLRANAMGSTRPDALVPAPIAPERLEERGFSQTSEIADWLSRGTGVPLKTGLLERHAGYRPQAGLDRGERRSNLQGAFFVTPGEPLPAHVAVIDDVITTGASGEAMATCLREAGAERVDLWALARTP